MSFSNFQTEMYFLKNLKNIWDEEEFWSSIELTHIIKGGWANIDVPIMVLIV